MQANLTKTALIIIDIQMDYFAGALPLEKPELAVKHAAELLEAFRDQGANVLHVQHENLNPDLPFMHSGTAGYKLHPLVQPKANEARIVKHSPNAFWQTKLNEQLANKGIERVIICGMMSQLCVQTTATSAMEHGYQVVIAEDACATQATEFNGQSLSATQVHSAAMAAVNIFADIHTTHELISHIAKATAA